MKKAYGKGRGKGRGKEGGNAVEHSIAIAMEPQADRLARGGRQGQRRQPTRRAQPSAAPGICVLIHGINGFTLYAGLRGPELKIDPKLTITDQDLAPGLVQ